MTPRPGDLVRVEMCGVVFFGIITHVEGDRYVVFTGNGISADYDRNEIEVVPLHFKSPCPTSFAEILKPAEVRQLPFGWRKV